LSTPDDISALEHRFMDAVQRRDVEWLEGRLGAEFVLTTGRPGHEIRSREEWLRVTGEEYEIESFAFEKLEVLPYGDVAVARSRYRQKGRMGGADRAGAYLMTDVWVRREGDWRLVTRHISPLGEG
jgi:ketosteroid isomerase-like protein